MNNAKTLLPPLAFILLAHAFYNFALVLRIVGGAWARLDPRYVQELSDRHCWLRTDGTWTLVHSRHAEVMAAVQQGDAFLSRLEGEWWMRFLGEGETRRTVHRARKTRLI